MRSTLPNRAGESTAIAWGAFGRIVSAFPGCQDLGVFSLMGSRGVPIKCSANQGIGTRSAGLLTCNRDVSSA